ncbi:hybrid sensor histidine kinase/response regulator [Parendozoicomonas haliclonae]|uniref:histidine kinase n=1 Tax=Parendozoicomonas haliclonae TaxID=1960125 RepID=A0A1X7AHX0_9GAMM|nr:response regulator [Parendozoicomonas haliclonae]SMA43468.1 Signal transduction histidine-protein kinase BarA [Parendozoicomonas haliclonae]
MDTMIDQNKNHPDRHVVDKNLHFSQRLSFRQTRYALTVAFIIGLVFSTLNITIDYRQQDLAIDQEVRALLEISTAPAARIAYNIDTELAQELLNGLLSYPALSHAELRDEFGNQLGSVSRELTQDKARGIGDFLFGRSRVYRQALRVDFDPDALLGYLQFEIDTYSFGEAFIQRAFLSFLSALLKGFCMALILLLLFYRMLTSPLTAISRTLKELRGNNNTNNTALVQIPCPPEHQEDEIGKLVDEINNLLYATRSNEKRRYRAERQLRDHLIALENKVADRTAEMTRHNHLLSQSNEELARAKEKALQTAKARATLMASMSHEIRTPLNSVMGMVDLALSESQDLKQCERLQQAHDAGQQLLELLTDILDFSRFESGKLIFESTPFNPENILERTTAMFAQQAESKGLCLQSTIYDSVPHQLVGDPTRLQQIIVNLISNAIKFTPSGYVSLEAKTETVNDVLMLNVFVRDSGIGIPDSSLDTVFDYYSQASQDTNRLFGGTGLGLALSRNMAEAMGGKLQVSRNSNGGSTFKLVIPYAGTERSGNHGSISTGSVLERIPHPVQILAPPKTAQALSVYCQRLATSVTVLPWSGPWPPQEFIHSDRTLLIAPQSFADFLPDTLRHTSPEKIIYLKDGSGVEVSPSSTLVSQPIRRERIQQALSSVASEAKPSLDTSGNKNLHGKANQGTARILVAEDNPTNLLIIEEVLLHAGFEVITCKNGQLAVEACEQSTNEQPAYDLILMDCNMPVLSGYQASEKIRGMPKYHHVPIIALTANAFEQDRDQCLSNGMQDYLSKPFDHKTLVAKIEHWLQDDGDYSVSGSAAKFRETELTQ